MKLNWNFQRSWGVLEKIPSVGEVCIFSGITHSIEFTLYEIQTQTSWSICRQQESDWLEQKIEAFPTYRFLLIILSVTLVIGCTEII